MHNPSIHECPKDCKTCGKTPEDKKGCKEEFIKYCEKCPNREWKRVFVCRCKNTICGYGFEK